MAGNERRPDRVAAAVREEVARVLSRDVQDPRITGAFVTVTGVEVSREAIRLWTLKFGTDYARNLRRRQGRFGDTWHLNEIFFKE